MDENYLNYENLTIEEISMLPKNEKRKACSLSMEVLKTYKKYKRLLKEDYIYVSYLRGLDQILNGLELNSKSDICLNQVIESISNTLLYNTSHDFFSNDVFAFYPAIRELKASETVLCCMSGYRIRPGNYYCHYRPILENLDTNNVYILHNTIKCDTAYYDYLPQDIIQFEEFNRKLSGYYHDNEIDFYVISTILGAEGLHLKKLKRN